LSKIRILLVDDEPMIVESLSQIMAMEGFEVTTATNVAEALHHISATKFDVLLSDLHMPGAGDGLTVVSAMRHANPAAVTMLLSAFPQMSAAAQAILLQTDEILVKPMDIPTLIANIKHRATIGAPRARVIESVAAILERSTESAIQDWYHQVEAEEKLQAVRLTFELRSAHLPQLFRDLVIRLRSSTKLGTKELVSASAREHGTLRRQQGYTAGRLLDELNLSTVSPAESIFYYAVSK
jgi:YesN/AraC family two-component response regulator